jgi:hypothetical protein
MTACLELLRCDCNTTIFVLGNNRPCATGSHALIFAGGGGTWVIGWAGSCRGSRSPVCRTVGSCRASRTAFRQTSSCAVMSTAFPFVPFASKRFLDPRAAPFSWAMKPPPNFACTSSSFLSASVSRLTYTVSSPTGTTSYIRTSIGVSLLCVLFGATFWRTCEKDWSASDNAGIWRDECGRDVPLSVFSAGRTGRMVHGVLWEATTEDGSHGVIATC